MSSILSNCTSGGCGAKIGPGELQSALSKLVKTENENLLIGYDGSDDAAVYRVNDQQAIVSTVDFFSPMVDDARTFGRIAATNALSDIYAMGGKPLFALNIVCFPQKEPVEQLGEILAGGSEKIAEAGAMLAGGHSIYDKEIKYGLAVNGIVSPDKIIRNNTPKAGDKLILTKPLGVGIIMAAMRAGVATESEAQAAINNMLRLNKYAAEEMASYDISACTDVTGFGLLVHALEMAGEEASVVINASCLPELPGAVSYAQQYMTTAGAQRNRNFVQSKIDLARVNSERAELMLDPQTSGGLLISVPGCMADELYGRIAKTEPSARIIGSVTKRYENGVILEN